MNPLRTRALTRQQIGQFITSERGIRAFEDAQEDVTSQYETLTTATFLTVGNEPTLGAERVLTPQSGELTGTDGGANSPYTIGLADTAVSPGTYGTASMVSRVTFDAKGRATSAVEVPIYLEFNVKAFGAVGDGAADDTAAFNAAIAAVQAAGGGGVYVPNGVYIISSPLIIPYNLYLFRLYGSSFGTILKAKAGASFDLITWNPPTTGYNHHQIDTLTLDGSSNTGSGSLINTAGMGGIRIKSLFMIGIPTTGNGILSDGKLGIYNHDVLVSDIYVDTLTGDSAVKFGPTSSDSQVDNLIVQGRGVLKYGIYFSAGAGHIRVTESHPYNCSIANTAVINPIDSIWFSDCTFDAGNLSTYNFYANGMAKCTFAGCQFTYSLGNTDLVTLVDCTDNNFSNSNFEGGPATRWGVLESGASDRNVFHQCNWVGSFSSGRFSLVGANSTVNSLGKDTLATGLLTVSAGTTNYVGSGAGSANETSAQEIMPYPGVIRKLRVSLGPSAPGAGQSITCTVRVNGVDTALVATVSGASGFAAVALSASGIAVNEGDMVSVKVVTSAGATTTTVRTVVTVMH